MVAVPAVAPSADSTLGIGGRKATGDDVNEPGLDGAIRQNAATERAFVALGSNLGDREAALSFAVASLGSAPGTRVTGASDVYQTAPVGPPPQGPYLNAVIVLQTRLGASALLSVLLDVEKQAGRERSGTRDEARTLDLDLLLYGDHCLTREGLVVPHPRLHERAFVLEPLCQACERAGVPGLLHPGLGVPLLDLAACVRDPESVRRYSGPLVTES